MTHSFAPWVARFIVATAWLALACMACGRTSSADSNLPPGEQVRSSKPRLVTQVPSEELRVLTMDHAAFAFDVLHAVLRKLGMIDAFEGGVADFSRWTGRSRSSFKTSFTKRS